MLFSCRRSLDKQVVVVVYQAMRNRRAMSRVHLWGTFGVRLENCYFLFRNEKIFATSDRSPSSLAYFVTEEASLCRNFAISIPL